MPSVAALLTLVHLIGLALAVGAATIKVTLLVACRRDTGLLPVYATVVRPITCLLIAGLVLLTLSGFAWFLFGMSMSWLLVVKILLVAAVWILGPYIDKVVEPRVLRSIPQPGEPVPERLPSNLQRYLALESTATGLFYLIMVVWVLG